MFLKLTPFNLPINLTTPVFLTNDIKLVLLLEFATLDDTIESKIDMYFPNGKIYFNYCYPSTSRAIRMKFGWDIHTAANLNIASSSRLFFKPTETVKEFFIDFVNSRE